MDCVKYPRSIVGKTISLDPGHSALASATEDSVYNFEQGLREKIKTDLLQKEEKDGKVAGVVDFIAHQSELTKSLGKQNTRESLQSQGIRNINVDASGRGGGEPLTVVILEAAKTDTNLPVFKVRVMNKVCAGSEMWVTASTIRMRGHVVEFGRGNGK
ncbi:MAG: hypothetical protein KGS72_24480 [Cyanobacteria bacterium REEB67]|nr:hypothetical protein [Cyanobacteria bacterium REEB67]